MLKNAYFLAKIGADTAENERNFAKNWQLPYGSSAAACLPFFPAEKQKQKLRAAALARCGVKWTPRFILTPR